MMLPTLISVSEAPESYFFCASAPPEVAASSPSAVETTASFLSVDISVSPFSSKAKLVAGPLNEALLTWRGYHLAGPLTTESPCGKAAGAASLVDGPGALAAGVI